MKRNTRPRNAGARRRALGDHCGISAGAGPARASGRRAGRRRAAGAPSLAGLTVDKLRDNLFVVKGGGGNTAVFVTADGVTLVDTKIYGWAPHLITRIKEITDKPVTRIINTHTHYDHTEGNPDFPATVEVVTHENTAKMMPAMTPPYGVTLTAIRNGVFYFVQSSVPWANW